jgi:hypothetical protein
VVRHIFQACQVAHIYELIVEQFRIKFFHIHSEVCIVGVLLLTGKTTDRDLYICMYMYTEIVCYVV